MSFVYPRTISVSRPGAKATGVGFRTGYVGVSAADEDEIATGVVASIQARREGQKDPVGLPADGTKTTWYVFIPANALAKDTVKSRDVVTDDQGERYQVLANYWDSLGYRLTCEKLEA